LGVPIGANAILDVIGVLPLSCHRQGLLVISELGELAALDRDGLQLRGISLRGAVTRAGAVGAQVLAR
jgi:hypothetical protein